MLRLILFISLLFTPTVFGLQVERELKFHLFEAPSRFSSLFEMVQMLTQTVGNLLEALADFVDPAHKSFRDCGLTG
jgi:hypothetical protein